MCMCVVWFQLSLLTSYAIHDLNPNHWRVHIHSTLTELSWYIFNPVCPSEKPARLYQIRDWRQSYQLFPHAARHERIEKHIHTFFPQISHQTNHLHCSTKLTNSFKRKIKKKMEFVANKPLKYLGFRFKSPNYQGDSNWTLRRLRKKIRWTSREIISLKWQLQFHQRG